jgi:hypothetical protein
MMLAVDRQGVGGAAVDQPGLFETGNDIDRKSEGRFRGTLEVARVAGHPQRVGCHRPHPFGAERSKALGEAAQGIEAALLGWRVDHALGGQAGSQPHGLFQVVQRLHLNADAGMLDPADQQAKAVRSEVDGGKQTAFGHADFR